MLFQTLLHAKRFCEELMCMVQWFLPPSTFLVFFTDALLGSRRLPKITDNRYKRLREKIRIPKRVTEFPTSDSWMFLWTCRSVLSQYFTFMRNRIKLSTQTISWSMDQDHEPKATPHSCKRKARMHELTFKAFLHLHQNVPTNEPERITWLRFFIFQLRSSWSRNYYSHEVFLQVIAQPRSLSRKRWKRKHYG